MKTSACFALGLFLFSHIAVAQSPVQEVIDNALIQQTNTNTQSIMSMLQQQLDEAQKQTQALNDQLTRMGDPSKVSLPALDLIKQDIAKSVQTSSNGMAREDRIRATTGAEAFGDNAYGLVPGISSTVTFKDGETGQRDPSLYMLQGALMGDLNALAEQSKEADERIAELKEQRSPLLDQLSAATDLASVLKIQTALTAIDSEITSAQADYTKSKLDYDVLMEKLKLQAQIESKGKNEAHDLERKHNAATAKAAAASGSGSSSSGSGSSTTKPFSNLTWGKKSP
ncbi:hypothetical protein [Prosthecobacter sp.]|uniref:hypothetical protein n=1 Tax=Prosthecobacter sp. TaxID=1965333 RepID=UPI00378309F5